MSVFGQKKGVLISSTRYAGLSLPLWEGSSFLLTASGVYVVGIHPCIWRCLYDLVFFYKRPLNSYNETVVCINIMHPLPRLRHDLRKNVHLVDGDVEAVSI